MKKKLLSFVLTAAMLSSMLVHPVALVASETEEGVQTETALDETEGEEFEEAEADVEVQDADDADGTDSEDVLSDAADEEPVDEDDIEEFGDEEDDGFVGENELLEGGITTVTKVEINNIVEPSPTMFPTDSYSPADASKYTVVKMRWLDSTTNTILDSDSPFEQGHNYILYVYVNPNKPKYEFPEYKEAMDATINGSDATCMTSDISEAELKITKKFHCAVVLSNADINDVVEPVALQTPDYNSPTVGSETGEYYIASESFEEGEFNGITWYNKTDDHVMTEEELFEAGKEYTVSIKVEPGDGFVFYSPTYVHGSINGEAAQVTSSGVMAKQNQIIASRTFVCQKADPQIEFESATMDKKFGCRNFKISFAKCETDGALTYSSSDDTVAEVDPETGVIHVKKDGTAVITCKSAETDVYNEGTTTCTLTISPLPKLDQPAKPSLAVIRKGVKVTWKAVAGAEKYRLFRKSGTSGWERVTTTTATTYVDTNVKSGVTYTYTVRCINDDETVYMSTFNKTGSIITYVAPPEITEIENLEKGVKVTWKKVAGAGQYRVFVKEHGTSGWTKAGDTENVSLTYTDLTKGKQYDFTVRCMNAAKNAYVSAYDPVGKTITYNPEVVVPDDVEMVSASAGTDGITIRWKAASKATKYKVFRRRWDETGWKGLAWVTSRTTTTFTDKKAVKGIKYYYTVRAASNSAYSADYDRVGVTAVVKLSAPQVTSLTNATNGIVVKWNAVSGAAKYRVLRKNVNGNWAKVADVSGTSYTVTAGLTSGKSYAFTVCCVGSDSSYAASSYNVTGKSLLYLSAPATNAAKTTSGIKVSWTTVAGASGYEVYRRTSSSSWAKLATVKRADIYSLVDKKASASVKYYYMVRAVNGDVVSGFRSSKAVSR